MSHAIVEQHELPQNSHGDTAKTIFGFWVYLMTDCILFATFFATYAVLHNNTYGGPPAGDLFSPPFFLTETIILLVSSFTCGLGMLSAYKKEKTKVFVWFAITFVLGLSFLTMELTEFAHLIREGNSWKRSGFLSAFFTLVSTHGLHITFGLIWILFQMIQLYRQNFTAIVLKRLACLSLFWHFLDVVWIFIFTLVYLMGVK